MAITDFVDNGQAGTTEKLFTNALATMPDADFMELYGALTPTLARQYVHLPDTPDNPITNAFIGEALKFGSVIEDIYIEATVMRATKTATEDLGNAQDELGFADVGMSKQYSTINALNTGKVSKYMYEYQKGVVGREEFGQIGEGIVASLRVGQVACLENQAAKVLVSSIPATGNVFCGVEETDTADVKLMKERRKIIDVAMEMSKVNGTYVATGYSDGAARTIYIIATKNKWAELTLDKAGVFHPEYLEFNKFENLGIKIQPLIVDKMYAPLTAEEKTAYQTASGVTWDNAPGMGEAMPDYIICDARYLRINPFIDRYQMFSRDVLANIPFTNFFLHMQNAISYQPNRKAVRVYSGEGTDGTTTVTAGNGGAEGGAEGGSGGGAESGSDAGSGTTTSP